jgi:YtkA-like protein
MKLEVDRPMRQFFRLALSLAVMTALAALTAGSVAAGNYAETSIVDGADTPPTAGEERELRVLLLQHGVTPVDHGSVDLTAWLPATDEHITVPATSVGDGEWLATVTFPTAGDWQVRIVHSVFETPAAMAMAVEPAPTMAVLPAAGAIAAMLLLALVLIVTARRLAGGRAATEPAGEVVRAG